jgi:preprotein translocase subunit SecA
MFDELKGTIRTEVIALLFHAQVEAGPDEAAGGGGPLPPPGGNGGGPNGNLTYEHGSLAGADAIAAAGASAGAAVGTAVAGDGASAPPIPQTVVKTDHENIGRNDPCWCGSGKKYKKCHGS